MICISGDTHGDYRRFSTKGFPQQKKMSREDYLIITGDFGGVWNGSKEENTWLDRLEDKPFTTLFIDGNHENYTMLNALPVAEWNGGKVHQVRDHVLHLMRGQMFQLDDMTFFTMGGATSHDIEGGVLDPNAPDFQEQYFRAALSGKSPRNLSISGAFVPSASLSLSALRLTASCKGSGSPARWGRRRRAAACP